PIRRAAIAVTWSQSPPVTTHPILLRLTRVLLGRRASGFVQVAKERLVRGLVSRQCGVMEWSAPLLPKWERATRRRRDDHSDQHHWHRPREELVPRRGAGAQGHCPATQEDESWAT